MTDKLVVVTSNPDKISSAEKAFHETGIEIERVENRFPEIQAETSLEVAVNTVNRMRKFFDCPLVREDHALHLDGLNGFPGPFVSYFDDTVPAEDLLDMVEGRSRKGCFTVSAAMGLMGKSGSTRSMYR